jgi:hypothetical protein
MFLFLALAHLFARWFAGWIGRAIGLQNFDPKIADPAQGQT